MTTQAIPNQLMNAPTWAQDVFAQLPCGASYDDIALHARMNRGSIANMYSEGRGPEGSFLLGKKRLFPRLEVVLWLMKLADNSKVGA